jgi:hypothetical protein
MTGTWIPYSEALRNILEDFEAGFGWGVAMKLAIAAIDGLLVEGRLEARADHFELRLAHENGPSEILAEGRVALVPAEFWRQYSETKERIDGFIYVATLDPEPTKPHAYFERGNFRFLEDRGFIAGIKSMSGEALGVSVRADQIPKGSPFKAPSRRGRPPGVSALRAADEAFVEQVLEAIESGESRAVVISRIAKQMPGGGTVESKEHRLRARVREVKLGGE